FSRACRSHLPVPTRRSAQEQLAAAQRLPPHAGDGAEGRGGSLRLRTVPGGRGGGVACLPGRAPLAGGGRSRRYHGTYGGLLPPQSAPGSPRVEGEGFPDCWPDVENFFRTPLSCPCLVLSESCQTRR